MSSKPNSLSLASTQKTRRELNETSDKSSKEQEESQLKTLGNIGPLDPNPARSKVQIAPLRMGNASPNHAIIAASFSDFLAPLIQMGASEPHDAEGSHTRTSQPLRGATRSAAPASKSSAFSDPTVQMGASEPHDEGSLFARSSQPLRRETRDSWPRGVSKTRPGQHASSKAHPQPPDPSPPTGTRSESFREGMIRVSAFDPPKELPASLDPFSFSQEQSKPSQGSTICVQQEGTQNLEDKVSSKGGGIDAQLGSSKPKRETHKPFWMKDYF
ncbi:Ty3/gypsy retrotransposon protein [Sesbania bispinosa]|nr:Ty3/gypsy retrotransposon protein [Sesbania bispinosa]